MAIIKRDPKKLKEISQGAAFQSIISIFEDARQKGISTCPFDIESYIETIDCIEIVIEQMADDKLSGYIEKRNDKYIIGINKYHHIHRRRFTMAHEFGHYNRHRDFLEQNKNKHYEEIFFETLYTSVLKPESAIGLQRGEFNMKDIEVEANTFASQLLIPESELKKKLEELKEEKSDGIKMLSEYFKVSPAAIDYRIKTMGR